MRRSEKKFHQGKNSRNDTPHRQLTAKAIYPKVKVNSASSCLTLHGDDAGQCVSSRLFQLVDLPRRSVMQVRPFQLVESVREAMRGQSHDVGGGERRIE
jgi:hypothetical protein